jgi:hypothetical protein
VVLVTQASLLRRTAFAVFALILPGLTGCAEPTSRELQPGSYRAVIDVGDGRQVPFGPRRRAGGVGVRALPRQR